MILREFNLGITSWKEDSQGVEQHRTKTPPSLLRLWHKSAGIFRQTQSDPAGQGGVVFPGFVSKQSGGDHRFPPVFSGADFRAPSVWYYGQGNKLATNPSTTFPPVSSMTWNGQPGTVHEQPDLMCRTLYKHFKCLTSSGGHSLTVLHISTGSLLQFRCENYYSSWKSSCTLEILN